MMKHRPERLKPKSCAQALIAAGVFLCSPAIGSSGYFQGLGSLPGGEFRYSFPADISEDGSVVVGESQSSSGVEAFRWTLADGMVGLGFLGGGELFSGAYGVSADGSVIVGGSSSPSGEEGRGEAFRWTEATGMIGLGDLPGGLFGSSAAGVSSDGSVVTGGSASFLSPNFAEAFLWTANTGLVGLGVLPGNPTPSTIPTRISADGSVVVGYARTGNGREAFRWSQAEGLVAMGDLPGPPFESMAKGVSADGSVIAGLASDVGVTAFRWAAGAGLEDLGRPPGGYRSSASDVTADGSVIVGDAGVSGTSVPAIWDELHGMRNLEDVFTELGLAPATEGWDLEEATAISADGKTVVGWGYHFGEMEGWIARLEPVGVIEVPTASSTALMVFAALLLFAGLVSLRLR